MDEIVNHTAHVMTPHDYLLIDHWLATFLRDRPMRLELVAAHESPSGYTWLDIAYITETIPVPARALLRPPLVQVLPVLVYQQKAQALLCRDDWQRSQLRNPAGEVHYSYEGDTYEVEARYLLDARLDIDLGWQPPLDLVSAMGLGRLSVNERDIFQELYIYVISGRPSDAQYDQLHQRNQGLQPPRYVVCSLAEGLHSPRGVLWKLLGQPQPQMVSAFAWSLFLGLRDDPLFGYFT